MAYVWMPFYSVQDACLGAKSYTFKHMCMIFHKAWINNFGSSTTSWTNHTYPFGHKSLHESFWYLRPALSDSELKTHTFQKVQGN
jgi:hypothetical protein